MRSTNKLSRTRKPEQTLQEARMRNLHTASPFRLAILALQDSDGYVDALLGLARDQIVARRPTISRRLSQVRFPRNGAAVALRQA
jgi:hypothetical protein